MYFTQEDYRKIENWLYKRSIKDNDLPIANSIKGNEKIPLLQDEENKISNIEDIAQYVGTTIIPDFYNITENNDDASFKSLREALSKVPRSHQKLGLVITYRNIDDKWCIFQFTSKSLSAWNNTTYWEDILQRGKPNGTASLDETGKIPMSQLPNNIGGGNNLELGETSTTAYPGDKGKKNANAISSLTNALDSIDSYSKTTRNQLDTFKNTKGQSQGIAPLDENGKVASSYLPSYVDDVLEYNTRTKFPTTGESGKIYIALDTNKTYRWGGTTYVELKSNIALGETSSTAYAGDKGKKNREDIENLQSNQSKFNTSLADVRSSFNNYASAKTPIIDKVEPHIANKQNPHSVTKAQVGLSNVTNDAQVKRSEMGANNGVATLDSKGKVLESQLPAGVTSSFIGTYDTATGGVDFGNILNDRIGKFAVNIGDCIIVYHQGITEPVYYAGTSTINFDINTSYTVFTVINANIEADSSIYIDAFDKAGNKVFINSQNGSTFFIGLKEPIIPITWNHTSWKSNNRIQSLVLDSNFLKFKEGDKIKFGSADNETFFNNTTVEIKEITISKYTDNTHFSAIFTLSNDFKNSEVVDMRCSVVLNGTSYTEKQRRITTNCPTYILGTMKDSNIDGCTSIVLPKGNITIDADLYKEYLPKVGDVVCAYDSPTITDYGLYAANILYIQTMDTSMPYAILGVAGITFDKYYLANNAFVTKDNI